VALALAGSSQGSSYELVDATFEIDGMAQATLTTDGSETLSATLPVGDYTVTLLEGWRLLDTTSEPEEVQATLASDNPLAFAIEADTTTEVRFVFETGDGTVSFGDGVLELGIDVQKLVARQVVFSEVMKNPVALPDAEGEWLELTNSGSSLVSLEGCTIDRDGSGFTIAQPLDLDSGASVALANSEAPGFSPDYVYSSLSLPNSGAFTLTLACDAEVLDTVTVDPTLTSNAAGASLSLDPAATSAVGNDDATAWCNAVDSYNGDLGTPGAPNPPCP
jgi:hypothetical protein